MTGSAKNPAKITAELLATKPCKIDRFSRVVGNKALQR
jgi:hypothetical protein